jgi:hypothetical protein
MLYASFKPAGSYQSLTIEVIIIIVPSHRGNNFFGDFGLFWGLKPFLGPGGAADPPPLHIGALPAEATTGSV